MRLDPNNSRTRKALAVASLAAALATMTIAPAQAATASTPAALTRPDRTVGKLYTRVPRLPRSVRRSGAPLHFTIEARQTSRDIASVSFFVGMFAVHNGGGFQQSRGITVRWYDPATKTWRKPLAVQDNGSWFLGPKDGLSLPHGKVLRIRVKIWFRHSAWSCLHQLEAMVDSYSLTTPSGKNVDAQLWTPQTPQYHFTLTT